MASEPTLPESNARSGEGAGCLAVAWFDAGLLMGAFALMWPIVSLSAIACPSGASDCGPGHALLLLLGWALGGAAVFTVLVLGLTRLAGRWTAARVGLGALGIVLLAIPALALGRAVVAGDAWLTFALATIWLAVPGVALVFETWTLLRQPNQ